MPHSGPSIDRLASGRRLNQSVGHDPATSDPSIPKPSTRRSTSLSLTGIAKASLPLEPQDPSYPEVLRSLVLDFESDGELGVE